jgi:aryl-phospho-beta-D-glucosidase BglC (GH1 family)
MKHVLALALFLAAGFAAADDSAWLPATPQKLPRWRGFNLLEKFHKEWSNKPFVEDDFKWIHELGFNFVRLPMDYRIWIKNDDWTQFNEDALREIDQAVEWGGKYGIHVCLNFHRAPGYSVAQPPEKTNLWTDPEAQRVFALHWATFAKRYKGIPPERLSFDLVNEPPDIDPAVHAKVMTQVVEAIRKEDPKRLIIVDGRSYGTIPCTELVGLGVAQATRGYSPIPISHYRASWMPGSDTWPMPTWPLRYLPAYLYGPSKPDIAGPMEFVGAFQKPMTVRVHVAVVSGFARVVAKADGVTVWDKSLTSGPGEGEWKEVVFKPQWNVYQNIFDKDYTFDVPASTRVLQLQTVEGDWLRLTEIGFTPKGGTEQVLGLFDTWGKKPEHVDVRARGDAWRFNCESVWDRNRLKTENIEPWKALQAQGVGVMVGEWGAYNKTPHDVVLRWAEDSLKNWKAAGWGWAMWNFRGTIGILDSERSDVQYEDWHGHKLDRQLLELLQRY